MTATGAAISVTSSFGAKCPRGCGSWLSFGTDEIGRTREDCPKCGRLPLAPPAPRPRLKGDEDREPIELPPTQPVRHHTTIDTPMPFEKKCKRSGKPFTADGRSAQFCHTCPECTKAEGGASAPEKKKKPRAAGAKEEKPRAPRNTGFRAETPRAKPTGPYAGAIGRLLDELEDLELKRTQILDAIAALEKLAA